MMNYKDQFIKFLASSLKNNPGEVLNEKLVYANLINYNLKEYKKNNLSLFGIWIKHFKTYNKICTFVDLQNSSFLNIYRNAHLLKLDTYKIYIPLNEEGYRSSFINQLIDYLDKKNISFIIKISSKVRNDGLLIRVNSKSEIDLIIDYIESFPLFSNYLISSNPFLLNYKKYGVCIDGILNYNLEVSLLIKKYLNHLGNTDDYDNASYDGFIIFLKEVIKALKCNVSFLDEYISDRLKLNIAEVKNIDIIKMTEQIYNNLILNKIEDIDYLYFENTNNLIIKKYEDLSFLEYACYATLVKKGVTQAKIALSKLISKNDKTGFVRDKRSRLNLIFYVNSQLAKQEILFCYDEKVKTQEAIKNYINNVIDKVHSIQDIVLKNAVIYSIEKFNNEWCIISSFDYLMQDDYSIFTRDNGIREEIKKYFFPRDFLATMKRELIRNNISVDYLNKLKIVEIYEKLCKNN